MLQAWLDSTSVQMYNDQKHTAKQPMGFQGEEIGYSSSQVIVKSVTWSQHSIACFETESRETHTWAATESACSVKVGHNISREKPQPVVMFMGSRFQALIDCK